MARRWTLATLIAALALMPAFARQDRQMLRDDFPGPKTAWVRGEAQGRFAEKQHISTDEHAHRAAPSETIQFEIEPDRFADYVYPTRPAPVVDDFTAGVWVRGERAHVQLLLRLVMPRERDPQRPDQPLTALVEGDRYAFLGRWQRLQLSQPQAQVKQQKQLLRAALGRDVLFDGAYFDQVVLRLSGQGFGQVWIDDLEYGPVIESAARAAVPEKPGAPARPATTRAQIELNRDQLLVNGQRFFPRGIHHSGANPATLKTAGVNAVWFDPDTLFSTVNAVADAGLLVVPSLRFAAPAPGEPVIPFDSPELRRLGREVADCPAGDAVLFWNVGGGFVREQSESVGRAAEAVQRADPQRPVTADVWDGLRPYSRRLDLLAVKRFPLHTSLELSAYSQYLTQRRQLAWPGTFLWNWVQTHPPEWHKRVLSDPPPPPGTVESANPTPDQIRLLTYLSIAAGARGLGYWADESLADANSARRTLLTIALLNQELQLLEPILLSLVEPPQWLEKTGNPNIKAAVLRGERGTLVLPMWLGSGAQHVPSQSTLQELKLSVPSIPGSMQAWEVSPGNVRALRPERVAGGMQVTLNEFDLTRAIVFTNDSRPDGLIASWERTSAAQAESAAQWTHELTRLQLSEVEAVERQLEPLAPYLPGSADLLTNCRERLEKARLAFQGRDFRAAYQEAQRAARPLRYLMRLRWEQAVKGLDRPTCSPYAASYFTLPRHWQLQKEVQSAQPGANVLPGGDFEGEATWAAQATTLDDLDLTARAVTDQPHDGRQCLKLEIRPKKSAAGQPAPAALERTYLGANSPEVTLPPGTLVRVSAWVRMEYPAEGSVDGFILFDSAGGEALGVRSNGGLKAWKQFHLYRRVPASGKLFVTAALTGVGEVFLDDVTIEPLTPARP